MTTKTMSETRCNTESKTDSTRESCNDKTPKNTVISDDKKLKFGLEIKNEEFQTSLPESSLPGPSLPEPSLPEPSLIRRL